MKKLALSIAFFCCSLTQVWTQSTVTFLVKQLPDGAEKGIGIRGSAAPLSWEKTIPLEKEGNGYSGIIEFPPLAEDLEFKFVYLDKEDQLVWENTQNRTLKLSPNSKLVAENFWNKEQLVDIAALEPLSPESLLADYEILKTMVLEVHPGTYRYKDEISIQKTLNDLKAKLKEPQTYGEAYLAMSRLTASLQCDHTKVGFNNQGKIINNVIHYQADKMPFTFRWIDGEMIVLNNASESEALKRGTAIQQINDVPVETIHKTMLPYIAADGATDQNRTYKMQIDGYDFRYSAFDVFYPLLYPLKNNSIKLSIQQYGKQELETVFVKPLTREARSEILYRRYPDFPRNRDDLWKLKRLNEKVALLEINSFGLFGWKAMSLDYKHFLAEAFQTLREEEIRHLVIDIRQNTGGFDEMKDELFSYLTENYRFNFPREGRTRYTIFPESLKPYVQTWGENPWFFKLKPEKREPLNGYYIFKEDFSNNYKKSDKEIYKGEVYLLTSAANTSLAFYLAHQFKEQELGTLIGQETGGNLNDINGGQILFLRLPHSKIEIDFPVMGGFSLEEQPNSGVKPDIETIYRRKDIVEGYDVEINTVLKLIDRK